ncbi:MAG: response regulator transcription factor [Lachnospiraceae bacterium]|nr:response regulator transcription factor [Lachnospiraceae bacterium]
MRILLADDDELVTMALKTILSAEEGMEVCTACAYGAEAVALYEEHQPDVVLSDIRMPYGDGEGVPGGLEAAERILKAHPEARILLLTTFLDDEYIIRALRLGVSGYLLKQDYGALPAAIRAAYEGQNVFGAEITAKMPALLAGPAGQNRSDMPAAAGAGGTSAYAHSDASAHSLTNEASDALQAPDKTHLNILNEREHELTALIAEGLSNKEIAERMFLSEGTVRNYLSTVLEKLELRDRTQLAIFYLTGRRTAG